MKVCKLSLLVAALLVGALTAASQALAAGGVPSDATLAAMGLTDLRVMTDSEGLAVRGLGYSGFGAAAFGKSWAVISTPHGSAGSFNGYNSVGNYQASGDNFSFAGVEFQQSGGHNNKSSNKSKGGKSGGGCNSCGYSQPKSIGIFSGGSSTGHR
jgi:hypothetical protein